MISGWIKLHREIMEGRKYFSEPFCRNMAWIDLLLLANHEPSSIRKRGILVPLSRGDVGMSLEQLSNRWRWSKGKVIRFLDELEEAKEIVTQKNNVTSCITILKYDIYQNNNNADGMQTGIQMERKQVRNKNEKKDKKEENTIGADAPVPKLEVKTEIDEQFEKFNEWLKANAPAVLKMKHPVTVQQYQLLKTEFNTPALKKLLFSMFEAMDNWAKLNTKSHAFKTVLAWANKELRLNPSFYETNTNEPGTGFQKSAREKQDEKILAAV